jgi:hypothetical protein
MHQNYEASRASDMAARVKSIEVAVNQSSARLKQSFDATKAQLPFTDSAVQTHFAQAWKAFDGAVGTARASVEALSGVPKEQLPVRPGDAEPFQTQGLSRELLASRVDAEVPSANRRPVGPDLAGAMRRQGGGGAAYARAEMAKVRGAQARGQVNLPTAERMVSQLEAAERLAQSPYPKGRALSDQIVADVSSERQVAQGKTDQREVSTVDADGNITPGVEKAGGQDPDLYTGAVVSTLVLRLDLAGDRTSHAISVANAYTGVDALRRREAALASRAMASNAEKSFLQGKLGDAQVWAEAALLVADVVTGWVPTLSLGRSCYELVSGRDLFSGAELSDLELAGRAIDIVTIGFGSKITKGWEAVSRIAQRNEKYQRIFASAKKYSDRMIKIGRNPVIHPEDLAHIADKHMPGGLNHVDEVIDGVAHRATVFNKGVDPLDLAGEAMELIEKRSPSIQNVPARSKGQSDFFLWNRSGLEPQHIGYSAETAEAARDVGIMVDRKDGRLVNIYPWNPKNPTPVLKGWD